MVVYSDKNDKVWIRPEKMFRETVIIMIKKKTSRQIVELLKTMEQGIKHLDKKLAEGKVRANLYLFTDLLEAFTTIETLIYKNEC